MYCVQLRVQENSFLIVRSLAEFTLNPKGEWVHDDKRGMPFSRVDTRDKRVNHSFFDVIPNPRKEA